MTTPAVTALRKNYPKAHISILARHWVEPIFSGNPAVDEVISCGSKGRNSTILEKLVLAKYLENKKFDLALLFPNSFESALIAWLARIPRRVGYATDARRLILTLPISVPEDRRNRHEIFYYLNLVDHISRLRFNTRSKNEGVHKERTELFLEVPSQGESGARQILTQMGLDQGVLLIGFNPGAAYGPAKCWPVERFVSLGKALVERFKDCHILVLGTNKEASVAEEICGPLSKRGHNLAGRTSLAEAMGLISRLDLLVTNDSGLMHVGAALGVPLVAIFGSTNPVTTGPWSANSVIIRHELPCSPCLKRSCPTDFRCLLGIKVEEVLQACLQQLSRK
ncbi:MAG: lipopolysaccharide heptosyltransferase II [Deltaproteobacteria bacterium]|nr:lipopolysaccharide heptosyltransferase II [Deltaproteobacteria bacterium]MDL1961203.1 lipopolysaccharide heptosyltransferase II [Deltaproteobacteria bacterium]